MICYAQFHFTGKHSDDNPVVLGQDRLEAVLTRALDG